MKKTRHVSFLVLFFLISLSAHAAAQEQDGEASGTGRYRVISDDVVLLVDSETGKVWKLSQDMSGKAKFEGITVEGLAYAASDADTLAKKVSDTTVASSLDEENRKKFKDALISEFSYQLEPDKIDEVLRKYVP